MEWKAHGSYEKVIDAVTSRLQMDSLRIRLERMFPGGSQQDIFKSKKHRDDYGALVNSSRQGSQPHTGRYAGAVFLLTAEEGVGD